LAKIARPEGPVSKPNGGGFSLKEVLHWDEASYREMQNAIHGLCQRFFDLRLPYHEQEPELMARFCYAAREKFPILARYVDFWPAESFATMYLKNTSQEARKRERSAVPESTDT
ncbi:hypothetical protein BV22DRAFT_1022003, partial [Leucogyrophana mollusca]